MNKFSVIVPTMWKDDSIFEMLDKYYECENVYEVILINNNREKTPNFKRHKKLLYIEPYENTFVYPAWNMGVRISNSDYIIIANDDVLFDVNTLINILVEVNKKYKFEELGFIGMDFDNYTIETQPELIDIRTHQKKPAWACLFMFHRINWKPIPEQLKIYYGDDFIKLTSNKIIDLCGFKIKTKMSASADTKIEWVKRITDQDNIEWNKLFNL